MHSSFPPTLSATNCVKPGLSIYDIPKICDKHKALVKLETRMRGERGTGRWHLVRVCLCNVPYVIFIHIQHHS